MPLAPPARKALLVLHLVCSLGWIGAVLAYLALGISAATGAPERVRIAWPAMELVGWWVIVPLALATVVTGIAMGLATRWGLFRHYWVVTSLLLTVGATVVLVLHMPDVSTVAARVGSASAAELSGLGGDLAHAGIGLLVLLAVLTLNVAKPRGLTRYGWRRQRR